MDINDHDDDENDVEDDDEDDYEDSNEDEDDDEDGLWITPNNIKEVKKNYNLDIFEDEIKPIACMTSDFAIQNVLMQINLNVASPNGKVSIICFFHAFI